MLINENPPQPAIRRRAVIDVDWNRWKRYFFGGGNVDAAEASFPPPAKSGLASKPKRDAVASVFVFVLR